MPDADLRRPQQPFDCRQQQPVFGDVDGELVVAHLQRDAPPPPAPQLVGFADPAPQHRQRLLDRLVALQQALIQSPRCQPHERVRQRLGQVGSRVQVNALVPPIVRTPRVPHQEDQPVDVDLRLDHHLQSAHGDHADVGGRRDLPPARTVREPDLHHAGGGQGVRN